MNEELDSKIRGIVGLYNYYKYHLNTPQRVGLLTLWVEISVEKEEYEVADVLQKELNKILNGEEDYMLTSPASMTFTTTSTEEIQNKIFEVIQKPIPQKTKPIETKKKGLKWLNQWGTGKFELICISTERVVLFNFGLRF